MHAASSSASPAVFVLFGASGGIGAATARALRGAGQLPVLAGRDADRLRALGDELDCPVRACDATDWDGAAQCLADVHQEHGRLDGVANLIGSLVLKPAHRTTREELDEVLRVNLGSAFAVLRAAATTMRSGGSVVLMSSAAARLGLPNHEAIAAAKAGVQGLALAAAASYASRGLRVNCVAPGLVDTPLAAPVVAAPAARKASEAMHPLGRLGRPDHVAAAIAWLLDPAQDWVTGQVLGVDGGLATVRGRG
ncbi:MAG: SDR family oxidoreductase [Planctomycetes bacterium]|nr:SDR family oxidoreductase [Planctomycetota bacterium]